MNKNLQLRIGTSDLKFAAAHMTLFPDGTKEPLHGHTYQVSVCLQLKSDASEVMIPFSVIKTGIRKICETWHHKLLLPAHAKEFEILQENSVSLEFLLCGKRYLLPREEAELLPISNVSTEALSIELGRRLIKEFETFLHQVEKVEVNLDELPQQGASVYFHGTAS